MSILRSRLIRLAHSKPELREHLLPILREASDSFEESVKGKKFTNPETGNKVEFGSLPAEEQKKLRSKFHEKGSGGGGSKEPKGGKVKKNDDGSYNIELPKEFDDEMYKATKSGDSEGQEESLKKTYSWVAKKTGLSPKEVENQFDWNQEDLGEPIHLKPKKK